MISQASSPMRPGNRSLSPKASLTMLWALHGGLLVRQRESSGPSKLRLLLGEEFSR